MWVNLCIGKEIYFLEHKQYLVKITVLCEPKKKKVHTLVTKEILIYLLSCVIVTKEKIFAYNGTFC